MVSLFKLENYFFFLRINIDMWNADVTILGKKKKKAQQIWEAVQSNSKWLFAKLKLFTWSHHFLQKEKKSFILEDNSDTLWID